MAGHSKFKNIMYRKGSQDAKRSRLFTRHFRAIAVAARQDNDPETNYGLRNAILAAKADNVPKDKIKRAIQGASTGENCEAVTYEGFMGGGVAVVVDMLTDNRRRAASNVRRIFDQHGGHMAAMGEVQFLFKRLGMVKYADAVATPDTMLTYAADCGARDCWYIDGEHVIVFEPEDLHKQMVELEKMFGPPLQVKMIWHPLEVVKSGDSDTLYKLMVKLSEDEDFQQVFTNHEAYLALTRRLEKEE